MAKAFVDDTGLGTNDTTNTTLLTEDQALVSNLNSLAQEWERLLFSTGGALNLQKCFWFLLSWRWNKGRAKLHTQLTLPAQIAMTSGMDPTSSVIKRIEPTDTFRTLGVYVTPDGTCKGAFTVRSRKILQRLWQEKLGWTDLIPESYQSKWCEWLNELINDAHKINIPRSFSFAKGKTYTLHVFVDASTEAYAAAVFVRVEDSRGAKESKFVESHLMTAKSRVTPAKAESVSRLELNSAVIGLRLGHAAAIAYCMDPKQIYFWTDSMNVLYWINTPANKLKTFVSNRVGQIQAHSESKQWRHVPTDQNPADIATRDISMIDMVNSELWWKGPKFLELPEANWPPEFKPPERSESSEVNNELKKLFLKVEKIILHYPFLLFLIVTL